MLNQLLSVKWYPLLFDPSDKIDFARTICFWLFIALAIAFSITLLLVKKSKREKFLKLSIPPLIAIFVLIGLFFLIASFKENEIVAILFYPLLILIISLAILLTALFFKAKKTIITATSVISILSFIAVLVCMAIYFLSGDSEKINELVITKSENAMLYVFSIALIIVIALICLIFGKNENKNFNSKSIAYASVCIAMSFALSYIRIVKLPQGGSITLCSLLPLMIYSYMFGIKKGVFAGLVYGILQSIQDAFIVHPMQFLLDYPIAFSFIGIAGLFGKCEKLDRIPQLSFSLGAIISSIFRFSAHVFSGVFAFSEYAYSSSGEPMNAWLYSSTYNSYVFIDIAISIVVALLLFSSKNFVKQIKNANV